jgi:RNA polymerase sigma-70 factor, ECF subfamily
MSVALRQPETATQDLAETLWLEFRPRLQAFVARRVANPADAEDIVQSAFLQMHRHVDGIRDAGRIQAWLYRVVRRGVADYYRSGHRRREVLSGSSIDIDALGPRPVEGDEDEAARREVAACLAPAVERLKSNDQEAIVLTEIKGLRLADAAQRVGVSLTGMKSRVQRARLRLREAMLNCCDLALDGQGIPIRCAQRSVDAPARRFALVS